MRLAWPVWPLQFDFRESPGSLFLLTSHCRRLHLTSTYSMAILSGIWTTPTGSVNQSSSTWKHNKRNSKTIDCITGAMYASARMDSQQTKYRRPRYFEIPWDKTRLYHAVFEEKAWATAHAFEHGGFWQVLEIAPNFLKGLLYACKWIDKCLWTYLKGFRVNSPGSEIGRFWATSLGYSPCFWTWRIFASVGNRSKLSEKTPICLQMDF